MMSPRGDDRLFTIGCRIPHRWSLDDVDEETQKMSHLGTTLFCSRRLRRILSQERNKYAGEVEE